MPTCIAYPIVSAGVNPWVPAVAATVGVAATFGYGVLCNTSPLFAPVISRIPTAAALALTFDDGPTAQFTAPVLDILDRFSARATFFLIGENVEREKSLAKEIADRGHTIGNHTFHHQHNGTMRGTAYWLNQLTRTGDAIFAATGKRPALFRAPMGFKTPAQARAVRTLGMTYIGWRQRGFDTLSIPSGTLATYINRRMRPGHIVTLHDGLEPARRHLSQQRTVEALPLILEHIAATNLRSVSLQEALAFPTCQITTTR